MTTTVMPDLVNFCANNVTIIVMLYIAVCKPHQYRAITTVRRRMFMITTLEDMVDFCFPVSLLDSNQVSTY